MLVILHVLVDSADIVVVNTVLNILHVFVGDGETSLTEMILKFVLRVLVLVPDALIDTVDDLAEVLLGLFRVYLRELLHLKLMLGHQVFLFLSQVPQIVGGRAHENLTSGYHVVFSKHCSS